jgi:(S)-2-hydroxy-acid oxidase
VTERNLRQTLNTSLICSFTKLPVILKGILTKEDARLACDLGVAGIIVSNHGARQVDNVPSSIEALSEVVQEVGSKIPVMFDGGVRQATDIFIALALGAKYVFIGRPVIYGLACEGQKGVENIIKILKHEFQLTMSNTGVRKIDEISREMVVHKNYYARL